MIIKAETALRLVRDGWAIIQGWTTNDHDQDCLILTNYKHARTDHVEFPRCETDEHRQLRTLI